MSTVFHYGKWIDDETPVTGVISNNSIEWSFVDDEICLNCSEMYSDAECGEEFECDSSHTKVFGDWVEVTGPTLEKEKDLCWFVINGTGYYPDKGGEFSAIEGEICTQIVYSKYTKRVNLCSPCYPGQGDLDSVGKFLAYDLPKELKYLVEEGE